MTELAHIACAGSAVWASGWFSAPFFRSLGGDQLSTQRSQLRFTFLRLPPDLLQLRCDGNPLSAFSLGGRLPGQGALAPGAPRPLDRGGLVAPSLTLGPKLAILCTQLVATLEQ